MIAAPIRMPLFLAAALCATGAFSAPPAVPPGYPKGQYDEDKVPAYTLPDPLVTQSGDRVTTPDQWRSSRRGEVLGLFARNVYGVAPLGRPAEMSWTVGSPPAPSAGAAPRMKAVTLLFNGRTDGPKMPMRFFLPRPGQAPTPIFLMVGSGLFPGRPPTQAPAAVPFLVSRGYGLVTCDVGMVEPDRPDGFPQGIRAYYAGARDDTLAPDAWGAIAAWAWAMSRAMDYLETDPDVDASKVAIIGVSRFGKAAMWAGAQDERFAIVVSGVSGTCGATLVRRGYGETVASIVGYAPYWFSKSFRAYAGRVNDLPVDWHMLIAAIAPRPLYISTAADDYWNDPHGQFLAAVAAEPVYRLLGRTGLGTRQAPPLNTPAGETIRYHCRSGGHGLTEYDWRQFADFADTVYARGSGRPMQP